jgi:hypothetical protein
MLVSRARAVMLGLLAVVLAGSVMTATASAVKAGPFWHHRPIGGEGEGSKVEPGAPENFKGTGGKQGFRASISGTPIEFASSSVQVKGAIFNSPSRGQIKAEIIYNQPTLSSPALKECGITIGARNIIVAKGYLTWKWNGTKTQLEESPIKEQTVDGIFSTIEPSQQKPFVEKIDLTKAGTFTTISQIGSGCGVLSGTFPVEGSYAAIPNRKVEEFSRKVSIRVLEPPEATHVFLQHYFDGEEMQGAEVGLKFGGNPAAYFLGQTEIESAQQEVAVFEK